MSPIEHVLDGLRLSARNERDKGDKFERLMLQFFKTDVQWSQRLTDVYLWQDWPGRHGRPDTGIDVVATDVTSGQAVAIQCKFYDPAHHLAKDDIDSFLSASGKHPFGQRVIVSTTDKWGRNAEETIENQQIPVQRLRFMDLEESSIDWSQFDLSTPEVMPLKDRKQLRSHQQVALEKVRDGLAAHDRGKLIMACGTGKTFTSLRIAEDLVPTGGRVLFLVPSISLLAQSLREWSVEADALLRPLAVCSDVKVGKRTKAQSDEDISVVDLAIPATTSVDRLHAQLDDTAAGADKLTVVFSTYQSIDVVAKAQARGLPDFDLVVCDEAHRTTGATLPGVDESVFVKVHDQSYLRARKRLYMTATPRIYADTSKAKAGQAQAVLASMDDEELYGPELHTLWFGEAVAAGLLTDYKVLVLAVDEKAVSATFQAQMADEGSELRLDDVAKIVGCWNGLAKRGQSQAGFATDPAPMTRAVAFARSIKDSQRFADTFRGIVSDYVARTGIVDATTGTESGSGEEPLRCEVEHVDGTFNVLARSEKLDWLKAPSGERECRVLSNARCLSEGVDVPALDAVLFLNPRKSVVDVVQSVGRVMRLAPGKQYGYIILPVGIPAGLSPEDALKDNDRYAVVWEVLQALRAHDERFDAMVNKIDINGAADDRLQVIGIGGGGDETGGEKGSDGRGVQGALAFPDLDEWREAIYAKIVTKVGTRRYWEDWARDVALIAERHTTRITALLDNLDLPVHVEFDAFLAGLRGNLNDSITRADAIDMLAQHLITRPVFDALFEGYSFAEHNPVSRVMQAMLDTLDHYQLHAENEELEKFYESVRLRAAGINNAAGKQRIIHELYERFFKLAFPKTADAFGIVYTPVEVVDFILRSVEHLLGTEFGTSLSAEGVHVLDPFTGTGSFVVRLLQSGLIQPHDLARKYAGEIHANEILLLAYYIAAINIEATYHDLIAEVEPGSGYEPFTGIVLADTFQMTEDGDTLDTAVFPANNDRAARQLECDLKVIIGNPPYSVGQTSANDDNANIGYLTLDAKIKSTYDRRSSASLTKSLYDSYIRAIRWASDRIGDAGIIGFVTNGGFIDSNSSDGLRRTLVEEFSSIYVYNLRGNQRTAGELSRREGGKIFGAGSRSTVAITFLIKKVGQDGPAVLHYRDIGDYLYREDKLALVDGADLALLDWQTIEPDASGDWINQRGDVFSVFSPMGDRNNLLAVFRLYSGGVKTNRDAWVYGSSRARLTTNVRSMVDEYNTQVRRLERTVADEPVGDSKELADKLIDRDPVKISWDGTLESDYRRGRPAKYDGSCVRTGQYRPFQQQAVYLDRQLNNSVYQQPAFFPTPKHENVGIYVVAAGSDKPFSVHMTASVPDLSYWGSSGGQYFPRWTWEPVDDADDQASLDLGSEADGVVVDGYRHVDNINPATVEGYRTAYGSGVTAEHVFHYVYGLLHSPDYRTEFAADLKKMLPRIPKVASVEDFRAFVDAGQALADLHVGYESVDPYPLTVTGDAPTGPGSGDLYDWFRVEKMRFAGTGRVKDRSSVVYNPRITVSGIPEEAYEYLLGSRSGIEWVMERYRVRIDKPSGIVNDPNDWSREMGDPRYVLDLLQRVVTVSVETVCIVKALPPLDVSTLT